MTSSPLPPPDDSGLPPRHRLSLEKLRKEALESELWNLDDGTESSKSESLPPPTIANPINIQPREPRISSEEIASPPYESTPIQSHTPLPKEKHLATDTAIQSPTRNDLGELAGIDDWDDADITIPTIQAIQGPSQDPPQPASDPSTDPLPPTDTPAPLAPAHTTENRRKSSLSINEIIAMASVALVLVIVAGFFLITALSGLPRIVDPHQKPDVPVSGGHFTIHAVNSYWRVPITTGPDADTVQRGTELIPILEITATGQDAALRVQFRNSDGAAVGDPITHAVRGETKLVIPSTAGLEDINIHNAYRTNLIDPWTVEILEASAGTTAGNAFRSLISVPISPNRR